MFSIRIFVMSACSAVKEELKVLAALIFMFGFILIMTFLQRRHNDPQQCLRSIICNIGANTNLYGKVGERMLSSFGGNQRTAFGFYGFPGLKSVSFNKRSVTYTMINISNPVLELPTVEMPEIPKLNLSKPTVNLTPVNVTNLDLLPELNKFNQTERELSNPDLVTLNIIKKLSVLISAECGVRPNALTSFKNTFAFGQRYGKKACRKFFPGCFMTTQDIVKLAVVALPSE